MKQITDNKELIVGKWYWYKLKSLSAITKLIPGQVIGHTKDNQLYLDNNSDKQLLLDSDGDIVRYLGSDRTWCHSANSQALNVYDIYGPIKDGSDKEQSTNIQLAEAITSLKLLKTELVRNKYDELSIHQLEKDIAVLENVT